MNANLVIDGTLYWFKSDSPDESHYLSAVFNAGSLADFFKEAGRVSDRDFHTGPVRNLPIPAYDPNNEHHVNLAAQSRLAHELVAALVAERQSANLRVNRNDILHDRQMQTILERIDESARAMFPGFCKQGDDEAAVFPSESSPTAQIYMGVAAREFDAGNAQKGADRLWDAAKQTLIDIARRKGWQVDGDDGDAMLDVAERLAAMDANEGEILLSYFSSARYYPDKVSFGFFDLEDGDGDDALRIVRGFIDEAERLAS